MTSERLTASSWRSQLVMLWTKSYATACSPTEPHLFVFMSRAEMCHHPRTTYPERHLPDPASVIFRKVTNCFRSEWGTEHLCRFPLGRQHRQGNGSVGL